MFPQYKPGLFTLALGKVRNCLAGASHRLEVDDRIVTEDLVLRHDVEMIAVAVCILAPKHPPKSLPSAPGNPIEQPEKNNSERKVEVKEGRGKTHPAGAHHCALPALGHRFVIMTMMDWPATPPVPHVLHGAAPVDVIL